MADPGRDKEIDVKLLELLACPLTKGPLVWDAERRELVSRLAKLAYPVRDPPQGRPESRADCECRLPGRVTGSFVPSA